MKKICQLKRNYISFKKLFLIWQIHKANKRFLKYTLAARMNRMKVDASLWIHHLSSPGIDGPPDHAGQREINAEPVRSESTIPSFWPEHTRIINDSVLI